MRIAGGTYRGRTLKTPKGEATRPTSDMVRQTLFNILATRVPDARFLDLFAGCGSVGLEAVSRGAAHATLVEKARPALVCLQGNIAALDIAEETTVLPSPVDRALEQLIAAGTQFDLIFLDPPFADLAAYQAVLTQIAHSHILAGDGLLIAQHDGRVALPDSINGLTRSRLHPIGDNALSFYRMTESTDGAA